MFGVGRNSIHLFRYAGVDVSLHWSWFLVAAIEIGDRANVYSSVMWNILEYLLLFFIVLLHEYGHALACRQVGGIANRILLWPLGGVAYVSPPPRPGATLWSIAAGPLVNVLLFPALFLLLTFSRLAGWPQTLPNAYQLLRTVSLINLGLLVFNILPIYPLDGGQILRSLLWFVIGRARSLMAVTVLGFVGVAGLIYLAIRAQSVWFGVLSLFILMNCWNGLRHARSLLQRGKAPRHAGFVCPSCKAPPQMGNFWACSQCKTAFDTFRMQAVCPNCASQFSTTSCLDCGNSHPMTEWIVPT
jgi:Zn-dependent protease